MEILKNDNNLNIIVNTEQNFKTDLGWQENLIEFENEIFNIAGSNPHSLSQLVNTIQDLGIELNIRKTDKNPLDIQKTHGSPEKLNEYGFPIPSTLLKVGIKNTWNWLCNQNLNDLKEWFDYKIH